MNDGIQDGLASLFRRGDAPDFDAKFAARIYQSLRRARILRNIIAITVVAGLVLASTAGLSLSIIFLGLARGQIANSPAWDVTEVVFWLPYAVASLVLAIFLRELITRAISRHFGSPT